MCAVACVCLCVIECLAASLSRAHVYPTLSCWDGRLVLSKLSNDPTPGRVCFYIRDKELVQWANADAVNEADPERDRAIQV